MAYEVVYDPGSKTWALWNTVVDSYTESGLRSPEAVADAVIGKSEFYFLPDGRIATAQYLSRESIDDYFKRQLQDVRPLTTEVYSHTTGRFEKETLPADQVKQNLQSAYAHALEEWDKGENRPDPAAKADVRQYWMKAAEEAKASGRTGVQTVGTISLTPEGRMEMREQHRTHVPPGFGKRRTSVVDVDRRYTLDELKRIALSRGLSANGSKKQIAARLLESGFTMEAQNG